MRRLVLHMITSIDGFIADDDNNVNPATQWDEEMHDFCLELFNRSTGRRPEIQHQHRRR